MPQVTDIRPQKKKDRVNVYLDGKFAFGLSLEAAAKAGLKIDQPISEEEMEKLIKEDEFAKVYDRVLKFLSYRPRSEKELERWFAKKQVGSQTKKLVLGKLKQLGYADDEEFARWWIEQRVSFRPKGKIALRAELRQKGVSNKTIAKLLESQAENFEKDLALKTAQKKLKTYKSLSPQEAWQKMATFLLRRGFSWEVVKEVVDEIFKKE